MWHLCFQNKLKSESSMRRQRPIQRESGLEIEERDPLRHRGPNVGRLNGPKIIEWWQKMTKNKESRQKRNRILDKKKKRGSFKSLGVPTEIVINLFIPTITFLIRNSHYTIPHFFLSVSVTFSSYFIFLFFLLIVKSVMKFLSENNITLTRMFGNTQPWFYTSMICLSKNTECILTGKMNGHNSYQC